MDYAYDYNALARFRKEHKLSKKDLLDAFGTNDYTGINRWLEGRTPVHVTALCRFCNFYSVPLSYFFRDADSQSNTIPIYIGKPDAGAQTSPTDMHGISDSAGKGVVGTHVTERTINTKAQKRAVEEGLTRLKSHSSSIWLNNEKSKEKRSGETDDKESNSPAPALSERGRGFLTDNPASSDSESNAILQLKVEHSQEIIKLEREHHQREDQIRRDCQASFDAERNRLMDIIERQNAELANVYHHSRNDDGIMAADD